LFNYFLLGNIIINYFNEIDIIIKSWRWGLGIGDWGLGIGDW
jgi:hypothetical protein